MASRTIATILTMKDQFTAPAKKATASVRNMNREVRRTKNQVKKMGKQMKSTMTNVVKYTTMAGVVGLAVFAKKSIDLASDLQEVQNVVDTTFKGSSKQINKFAKTALKSYGLTTLQAKKYSSTLGAIMKSSGVSSKELNKMSIGLTGLAGDMASFYNLKPDEAFDKLRSAIGGETEPMKALGVNMSVANMEAFALTKGIKKSWKEMSQAEQTTLRYKYLMEKTSDAQGDFAKTNKSWANQLKIAKATTEQMGASLAQNFLPVLNNGLININNWIEKLNSYVENNQDQFKEMADKAKEALQPVQDIAKFINGNWGTIAPIIMTIVGAYTTYKAVVLAQTAYTVAYTTALGIHSAVLATGATAVNVITVAQWAWNTAMNANPIGLVIGLIAGLVAMGIALYKNWDKITAKAKELWAWLKKLKGVGKIFTSIETTYKKQGTSGGSQGKAKDSGMKKYARGGIASEASIFGEAGSEIAIPLKRTPRSLSLLDQANNILGSKNNGTTVNNYSDQRQSVDGTQVQNSDQQLTLNFYGDFYGWSDFKNRVGKAVTEMVGKNKPNLT